MINCQRHLFDIPDGVAYLNCGYMSPLLREAVAAGTRGLTQKSRPWEITHQDFFTESEAARRLFATLVGADANDIAIIPAASYGIALAAANIPLRRGQTIIVLDGQFPSHVYAWRELAASGNARLKTLRRNPGEGWTEAILEAIGPDTAIVAVANCHWIDGTVIDLEAVARACRGVGAALVVDATQSLGVVPLDAARMGADFVIAATYKWLLGPYSLGFAYIAPKWQSGRPLEHNWIDRLGSEDFNNLIDYQDNFQPGARRFDVGERANFALLPAAIAALERLLGWGVEEIASTIREMTAEIASRARVLGLGAEPASLRSPHYLSLEWRHGDTAALMEKLAAERIFISLRGGTLRITPHVYNNAEDIDRLIAVLGESIP